MGGWGSLGVSPGPPPAYSVSRRGLGRSRTPGTAPGCRAASFLLRSTWGCGVAQRFDAFLSDEAVRRIIAEVGVPLDAEKTAELKASMDIFGWQLVGQAGEFLERGDDQKHSRRGRPRNVPRRRFLDALMGEWMVVFERLLRTSAHGTTYEACGPLVRFLYGTCREVRVRVLEGDVCDDATAAWIAKSMEDRPRGLTKAALRKHVERGTWLKLADDLEAPASRGEPEDDAPG